jgi:transcriptional regulator with XRE-family HTH domain
MPQRRRELNPFDVADREFRQRFFTALRGIRVKKNLSQSRMATRMETVQSGLSKLEDIGGNADAQLSTLQRYGRALDGFRLKIDPKPDIDYLERLVSDTDDGRYAASLLFRLLTKCLEWGGADCSATMCQPNLRLIDHDAVQSQAARVEEYHARQVWVVGGSIACASALEPAWVV